ncbi:MAG: Uma2 family endonuclease [Chloroflexota bacterium]
MPKVGSRKSGEPVWELAHLFPYQGDWSVDEYLTLNTNHLIEYVDGYLEFLPMPTLSHQDILAYLYEMLKLFVTAASLGKVYFAPLRVRLTPKEYREPDIVFIANARLEQTTGDYPLGADLVMEIVSGGPEDRVRDLEIKPEIYAEAGIPEYWIVDPKDEVIIVLHLEKDTYAEHGRFTAGDIATSALLPGFSVLVADVWAAAQR